MKFGLSQIKEKTPIWISNIKNAVTVFMGGVITFMPFIQSHTGLTYEDISAIAGLTILAVNTFSTLFGVNVAKPEIQAEQEKNDN